MQESTVIQGPMVIGGLDVAQRDTEQCPLLAVGSEPADELTQRPPRGVVVALAGVSPKELRRVGWVLAAASLVALFVISSG